MRLLGNNIHPISKSSKWIMLNIPKELDILFLHSSTLSELITPRRILSISSKYCIHHLEFFPVSKCYWRYTVLFIQEKCFCIESACVKDMFHQFLYGRHSCRVAETSTHAVKWNCSQKWHIFDSIEWGKGKPYKCSDGYDFPFEANLQKNSPFLNVS